MRVCVCVCFRGSVQKPCQIKTTKQTERVTQTGQGACRMAAVGLGLLRLRLFVTRHRSVCVCEEDADAEKWILWHPLFLFCLYTHHSLLHICAKQRGSARGTPRSRGGCRVLGGPPSEAAHC